MNTASIRSQSTEKTLHFLLAAKRRSQWLTNTNPKRICRPYTLPWKCNWP